MSSRKKSLRSGKKQVPRIFDHSKPAPSSLSYLIILIILVLALIAISMLNISPPSTGQITGYATSSSDEVILSQQQDELRELLGGIIEEDVQPAGQLTVAQPQASPLSFELIIIIILIVAVVAGAVLYMRKKKSGVSYVSTPPSYQPAQ